MPSLYHTLPLGMGYEKKIQSATFAEVVRCTLDLSSWGKFYGPRVGREETRFVAQMNGLCDSGVTGEARIVTGMAVVVLTLSLTSTTPATVEWYSATWPTGPQTLILELRRAVGSGTSGFFFRSLRTWMQLEML